MIGRERLSQYGQAHQICKSPRGQSLKFIHDQHNKWIVYEEDREAVQYQVDAQLPLSTNDNVMDYQDN